MCIPKHKKTFYVLQMLDTFIALNVEFDYNLPLPLHVSLRVVELHARHHTRVLVNSIDV